MKKLDNEVDIDSIKSFLMNLYKVSNWEDCIKKQQFGDCEKICRSIYKNFPGTFDYLYDIYIDYSPIAMKKLNDGKADFGNHFVLVKNKKIYDFGKGTNSINGIYLLTQYEDMRDRYKINLSSKEQSYINNKIKRTIT